jgi:hypothetical protein
VSPSGDVEVEDGADQTFTVTADAGYRIESVLADGTAVATFGDDDTSYTYTWTNVTADGTLSATFVEQTVEHEYVPSEGGVDVPVSWMATYYPGMTYEQMETKVNEKGQNGRPVWESYVANLNPTDSDSQLNIDDANPAAGSFTATVQPDRRYCLQYAGQLDGTPQWTGTDWWTNTASTATTHEFTDGTGAEETLRFYRIQVDLIPE